MILIYSPSRFLKDRILIYLSNIKAVCLQKTPPIFMNNWPKTKRLFFWFSAKQQHDGVHCKSKDWLARNQNNVLEWNYMSDHFFRFPITYSAYFSSKFDSSFDIGVKRKKPKVAKMEKCCWTIIIFNKTGAGGSRRFLAVVWWCHRCSSLFISSYQCTAIRTPKDIHLCLLSFSKIITFYTVKGFISIGMFGKKGSS